MNKSLSLTTPALEDSRPGDSVDGLSLIQLVAPTIPLMLLVTFFASFHPNVTAIPQLHWSGTSNEDANGKVSVQVQETLMIEGEIDWRIGSVSIAQESIVALYEEIPSINQRIEETHGLAILIAGLVAFPIFVVAALRLGWHPRWSDDPPRVPPARAVLIIVCVLPLSAGVCWMFKKLNVDSVEGLSHEFGGAKEFGLRMVAILLLVPVTEELVFRASLQRVLARRFPVPVSVVLQALCFGVLHLASPLHVLVGVFGGLCFGAIYAATNRLSLAIATHSVSNAVFIMLIL